VKGEELQCNCICTVLVVVVKRIQILCNINRLSDYISHNMPNRPSKTTELIVLMVTNSGAKSIL